MSSWLPWAIPIFAGVYVLVFTSLSIGLNLRLRSRYPQIYEAVGKPRLFSRYPDFLWDLSTHRKALGVGDWRLRTVAIWLYCLGMVAALGVGLWSGWQFFQAR